MGDPEVSHITNTNTVRAYNDRKVQEAKTICFSCPVTEACLEQASPVDLFWTVRGGHTPDYLVSRPGPKRVPTVDVSDYLEYRCTSGRHQGDRHRGFKFNAGKRVEYCLMCDSEQYLKVADRVV
jgi:hypothetical protein